MGKLLGVRQGLKLKYFKNNSANETYGFELQGGVEVPPILPGDTIALTEEEVFIAKTSRVWSTMDIVEISADDIKREIKDSGKKVVNANYDEFKDILSKTDEEIVNDANELKSASKVKRLKEECEKANKGYLLIKELQRILDSFSNKK